MSHIFRCWSLNSNDFLAIIDKPHFIVMFIFEADLRSKLDFICLLMKKLELLECCFGSLIGVDFMGNLSGLMEFNYQLIVQ
mgnify:FL=1